MAPAVVRRLGNPFLPTEDTDRSITFLCLLQKSDNLLVGKLSVSHLVLTFTRQGLTFLLAQFFGSRPIENEPRSLARFLDEAQPDRERLRLVAQALAGAGLKGKSAEEAKTLVTTTASEQVALGKLTANWRALVEAPLAATEGTLLAEMRR
jgi:hypothetical protein